MTRNPRTPLIEQRPPGRQALNKRSHPTGDLFVIRIARRVDEPPPVHGGAAAAQQLENPARGPHARPARARRELPRMIEELGRDLCFLRAQGAWRLRRARRPAPRNGEELLDLQW
jgi:hypothetical protein